MRHCLFAVLLVTGIFSAIPAAAEPVKRGSLFSAIPCADTPFGAEWARLLPAAQARFPGLKLTRVEDLHVTVVYGDGETYSPCREHLRDVRGEGQLGIDF